MLNNDISNVIYETFSVTTLDGTVVSLCANGDKKEVDNTNKLDYIKLHAQWTTNFAIADQLKELLHGFFDLIPQHILQDKEINLSATQLDLMLNGKQTIEVDELRPYVVYQAFNSKSEATFGEGHPVVVWLWQMVAEFNATERALFLQFFTGCSKIPLDGFDPALNITQGSDLAPTALPKAHTCFNQLVLPPYESYDDMKTKFLFAMNNTEGFELS